MSLFAAPLQTTAVLAALIWPLVAGVTLVLWTKARAADRQRKLALIDGGLSGLFHTVAAQPVPDRLELVVEALEEHAEMTAEVKARRRKAAPTA